MKLIILLDISSVEGIEGCIEHTDQGHNNIDEREQPGRFVLIDHAIHILHGEREKLRCQVQVIEGHEFYPLCRRQELKELAGKAGSEICCHADADSGCRISGQY